MRNTSLIVEQSTKLDETLPAKASPQSGPFPRDVTRSSTRRHDWPRAAALQVERFEVLIPVHLLLSTPHI